MSTATTVKNERMITLRESDALRAMPAMNPQALLAAAIDKGASVETLERLVALAKDMRAVAAREAFNEAIAEFQRRCPPIKKNKTAAINDRFTYRYADLGEILPTISPLMGELGLSVSWRSTGKPNVVVANCRISHKLGHSEDSGDFEIPYRVDGRMNPAQAVGSAITYAKRYALTAVLGISPEDDDDAQATRGAEGRAESNAHTGKTSHGSADTQPPAREPNEEELIESRRLFPDPEREALIAEIKKLGKKIPDGDKAEAATTYLGMGVSLEAADMSALADLKKWCEARIIRK